MKKISKILISVVSLLLLIFPLFANHNEYSIAGEYLKELEIIKGDGSGDLRASDYLTREQAIVVLTRLMSVENEAKIVSPKKSPFIDVDKNNFYASYIEYARLKGWTNGLSKNEFGFEKKSNKQMMASFLLRSLNYKNLKYENEFDKAIEIGILDGVTSERKAFLKRGEMFLMIKNTLNAKIKDSEITLKEKLFSKGQKIKPKVLEIISDNLKTIEIKFNHQISTENLMKNIKITPKIKGYRFALSSDNKTLKIISENKLKQFSKYQVDLSKLKLSVNKKLLNPIHEVQIIDQKTPEVEKLYSVGNNSFAIKFSEPMDVKSRGIIDIGNERVKLNVLSSSKFDSNDSSIFYVNTSRNFKVDEEYNIRIRSFKDLAGNSIIDTIRDYNHKKTEGDLYAKIVSASEEYVEIEFSRMVTNLTEKNFYHTFENWTALGIYKTHNALVTNNLNNRVKKSDFVDRIWVRFSNGLQNYPLTPGNVKVNIKSKISNSYIKDAWGNKLGNIELDVSISRDSDVPKVKSVNFKGPNNLEIIFNKSIDKNSISNSKNIEIKNLDGSKIKGLSIKSRLDSKNSNTIIVSIHHSNIKSLIGKNLLVKVMNISDATVYKNKMRNSYTTSFEFVDKEFSEKVIVIYDISTKKLIAQYGEEVSDNAADSKNYIINSNGINYQMSSTNIEISGDRVTFNLNEEDITNINRPNSNLVISNNITDLSGNKWSDFQRSYTIGKNGGNQPEVHRNSEGYMVYSISDYELQLQFNQVLSEVNLSEFEINLAAASSGLNPVYSEITNNSIGSLVTLKFEPRNSNGRPINFLQKNSIKLSYKSSNSEHSTKNRFGKSPKDFENINVINKIPVTMSMMNMSIYSGEQDVRYFILQGRNPDIAIMYSSDIQVPNVNSYDIFVNGTIREVEKIEASNYIVNIFLKQKLRFGEIAHVIQKNPIYAKNSTKLEPSSNRFSAYALAMDIDQGSLVFRDSKMILKLAVDIPISSLKHIRLKNADDAIKEIINRNTIVFKRNGDSGKVINADDKIVIERGFRFENGLYVEQMISNVNAISE